MPLLNYTTTVPATKTIGQIHALLVMAGAQQIMTMYDIGVPVGVAFTTETPHGPRTFSVPIDATRVQAVLERERVERKYRELEHAQRVAWRIMKDWLEAQLAIIRTEMVTLDQVMLSYMETRPGQTVYDLYRSSQLPELEPRAV